MCWYCDLSEKRLVAEGFQQQLLFSMTHREAGLAGAFYSTIAFYEPTGGLVQSSLLNPVVPVITPDDVPDDISTTHVITVDGPSIISTLNTIGDQDFFKVELVEGRIYDIGQYMVTGGPSGVPLADAWVEIYDSNGNLLQVADGGGPNTPYGLDALMTFVAPYSGTFYVNARAFDDVPLNGTTGDFVGDYELFVKDVTGRPSYMPYYDINSPLHSIDWGSQVDRTSRNPDGEEGPRVTGNPYTGVGHNPFGIEGKNVITVYFARAGDIFVSEDPTSPGLTENIVAKGVADWEKAAFMKALSMFEKVADLVFVEVGTRAEADFKIITYNGTPGAGASLLGRMSPPNEQNEGQAEFNSGDVRWTEAGLQQGGFYFPTLMHEFGHGLGMSHPHDQGGRSSVMRGAGGGTAGIGGGLGDFGLSQQIFTIMSYNAGWQTSGYGTPRRGGVTGTEVDHFGWIASLSPLDIAVIQDKYGVNADWAKGDDVYIIPDVNEAGTYYESIWDAGGIDEIRYDGARDAVIDLRAATLKYEEGGGGRVSHAWGIHGGFTIANGVVIENATGGSGNDTLTGNDADNILNGRDGDDVIDGGAGNDIIIGGRGRDVLTGGEGDDVFVYETLDDSPVGAGRDLITDFAKGDKIDLSAVGAAWFIGSSQFSGRAGEVRYAATADASFVELDADGDGIADLQIEFAGSILFQGSDFGLPATGTPGDDYILGTNGDDVLIGGDGNDTLIGLAGNDRLEGGAGNDVLIGGHGKDVLIGGPGSDRFVFSDVLDSPAGSGRDQILDFESGIDKIDLSGFGSAFSFVGKKAFSGTAGELRIVKSQGSTLVEADLNGDRVADFQIELVGKTDAALGDFIFSSTASSAASSEPIVADFLF